MNEYAITKWLEACREQDWKAFDAACVDAENVVYLMSCCENESLAGY